MRTFKMAASTGGENIEETPSVEITSKLPNNLSQIAEKTEEVSTNGTGSCSSFAAARKGPYTLRPSLFSSNSASGSAVPAFGSHTTPQFSSLNPPFNLSPRKNPIILRPSVFGSASDTEKDVATRRPVVLKSSQLGSVTNSAISTSTCSNASSFVLSPAKLNNPFHKTAYDNGSTVTSTSSETTSISSQESEKENPLKLSSEAPKVSFVPLASSACSSTSAQSQPQAPPGATTTVPTFVFGQNLHERVEALPEAVRGEAECSGAAPPTITSTCDGEVSKANGVRWDSDMVFSRFIEQELPDKQSEGANDERKRKSLSEAAREYEESRAVKRKYEEVKVKTGEEEEINILQMNCKLFAFNKEKSNWMERGRGTLRLNDLSVENKTQSRVVMRVSGSLRVVLNTKIWAEMTVDRPSDKSVRLTAMDSSGEIKVFLVMAGVKEIDQLYRALEWRVNNQKKLVASASEKRTETNVS